jgi:hypothetical protein
MTRRVTCHGSVISEGFADMILEIQLVCVTRWPSGLMLPRCDSHPRRISQFLRVSQSSYVRFSEFRIRTDKQHRERMRRRIAKGY